MPNMNREMAVKNLMIIVAAKMRNDCKIVDFSNINNKQIKRSIQTDMC